MAPRETGLGPQPTGIEVSTIQAPAPPIPQPGRRDDSLGRRQAPPAPAPEKKHESHIARNVAMGLGTAALTAAGIGVVINSGHGTGSQNPGGTTEKSPFPEQSQTAVIPNATPGESLRVTFPPATEIPSQSLEASPATGFSEQNGNITYITEKGEVLNVPQIAGLKAELQVGKVIYLAEKSNSYGLKENQYAGEYKPNVVVENKQTGGVVLKSPVVSKLVQEKLAAIPNQKDKWTVPVPVDVTSATSKIFLNFETGIEMNTSILSINVTEYLPVTNIIMGGKQIRIFNGGYYNGGYVDQYYMDTFNDPQAKMVAPMRYLIVGLNTKKLKGDQTVSKKFGDKVITTAGKVVVSYIDVTVAPPTNLDVDSTRVLYAGNNIPVFLASN